MAATREARKREMLANLDNDAYIKALVDEAYATIFTGSTTNTVAQKKVKRTFEAGGCHIGASTGVKFLGVRHQRVYSRAG